MKTALAATTLLLLAACQSFDPEAAILKADLRFEEGDFGSAIFEYDRVLHHDPLNIRALNNRGVARLRLGDVAGALADLDAVLEIQPSFAEAHYNRGLAHFQKGDVDAAISDYSAAVGHHPRYAKAWAARGIARSKKGDLAGAALDYKTALDVAPADWTDRKAVEAELAKLPKLATPK